MEETFSPIEYIATHPHNPMVVERVKREILAYLQSIHPHQVIRYSDWYVGIAIKPDTERHDKHRSNKELEYLKDFESFYAYSLANARKIEEELCNHFGLGNCSRIGGATAKTKSVYLFDEANSPQKKP